MSYETLCRHTRKINAFLPSGLKIGLLFHQLLEQFLVLLGGEIQLFVQVGPPAKSAGLLSITPRAYQYYEEGKRFPDFHGLLKIADCLHISIDYLVGRKDERA